MIIIGHRGARALEPENTLRAVRKGARCADYVEIDVRLSLEGIPVVIHDPTLERTTNGRGKVREYTLEELRRLDAGLGEKIPILKEVLDLVRLKCGLIVEIKEEGSEEEICEEILENRTPDIIIASFSGETVMKVREILPDVRTGYITFRALPDPASTAKDLGADLLLPRWDLLSSDLVSLAHGVNLRVIPWILNTEEEFRKARALGVDGLATDDPCRARGWIRIEGKSPEGG